MLLSAGYLQRSVPSGAAVGRISAALSPFWRYRRPDIVGLVSTRPRDPSLGDRWDPAVRLEPYSSRRAAAAARECDAIRLVATPTAVAVEHVGSTAVPGLVAKPIIDIQVSVGAGSDPLRVRGALEQLGYSYVHDPASTEYVLFVKPSSRPRSHHVHVCVSGGADEYRHLAVRDYLCVHPDEVRAYAALKSRLVAAAPFDRLAYIDGKGHFMAELEVRALAWATRVERA
ncbi:MAG: GrpB family protein [Solirubrobacteraceae bacterium]